VANFTRYVLSITFKDGVQRDSVVSYYVLPAEAKAYFAAADKAARDASALGVLATKVKAMTLMFPVQVSVSIEDVTDPVTIPAVTTLRGNKLAFAMRSGGRGLTTTIPGRDPASFEQGPDSLLVALDTPSAMDDFVLAVGGHVVDQFGNTVSIIEGRVVD
jgi:hypothetical protein